MGALPRGTSRSRSRTTWRCLVAGTSVPLGRRDRRLTRLAYTWNPGRRRANPAINPHMYPYRNEKVSYSDEIEGPFVEVPLKTSTKAKVSKPGPDRVIINGKYHPAGQTTYCGAEDDFFFFFFGCKGTSRAALDWQWPICEAQMGCRQGSSS
ncbi:Extracellular guanyl-specific ribonuclease [Colletotrichum chlorophyti]|uniref:Extracellular guanyl-specific ribonuclease n=1 Tax=Colletotrichum chlorophyti TaxID=708187 RepID=A0A1Q8RZC7_9PEZI|nr:Extracellular guanyl-specific ribonuclease [Colletotrichum chlorophyti]